MDLLLSSTVSLQCMNETEPDYSGQEATGKL